MGLWFRDPLPKACGLGRAVRGHGPCRGEVPLGHKRPGCPGGTERLSESRSGWLQPLPGEIGIKLAENEDLRSENTLVSIIVGFWTPDINKPLPRKVKLRTQTRIYRPLDIVWGLKKIWLNAYVYVGKTSAVIFLTRGVLPAEMKLIPEGDYTNIRPLGVTFYKALPFSS